MQVDDIPQLKAVIGPNADFYVRAFGRIDASRWGGTWNWSAFVASTAWFVYRGMSGYAVLNFLAPWLALALVASFATASPILVHVVLYGYLALTYVVVPIYANNLYYERLKREFARAEAPDKLPSPPGLGRRLVAAFVISLPVLFFFWSQTAYIDYIPRSQVSEAISLLGGAKTPIAEYRADKGKWPDKVEQVAGNTSGKYVERIEITSGAGAASGPLTITATMKATGVNSSIAGKTVQQSTEDGKSWTCRRGAVNGMEEKYLPAACRQ